MKHSVSRLILLIVCILSCAAAVAEASNSLYHLSLEELLDVKVSVASTESETVIETPAIVSRYNRIDLEKMGITTLREMFNFIPGIIVQDSLAGWASVQIRGIDETFNQKVLFLLDGIPYHQPSHSLIPMEGIPWESISHVEVIRGPGAVFYGTQASGGVLNVITKKDVGENSASIKVGSHGLYEGSAYYNSELSETSALYLAAEYRTEDGYSAPYEEVFPSVGLIRDDVNRYLERTSGLLRYTSDGFTLLAHAFSDATVGINDAYTDENTLQPMVLETMGRLIHMEKRWSTDNSQTTLFADYNHYTFEIQLHNLFAPDVGALVKKDGDGKDDYRLRFGAKFAYKVNESLDLAMGLEQETRSIGDYRIYFLDEPNDPLALLLEKGKTDEFSAYAQLGYTFKNWRFLMGGRFTDNENNGQKITPRAAFVYKVDEHQSIKALYSTGFNSPNPTQTDINLPGDVVGNESLSAEIVKTFDIAYSYSKSNVLFVANVYHLEAEDFIQRKFSEPLASISFFNEGGFKRKGAELDLQMASEGRKLFVNVSYQKEGNSVLLDDPAAFHAPKLTFSVGASMDIFDTHSIGGDISYIGARHNLDGYTIVNLNYTARLSDLELFAVARNVLDEEILNPNISTQNSELVARGEEGLNLQLGFRVHF